MSIDEFRNKVICGDCLDILPHIPSKSVDLGFTDPPYNVGKNYGVYTDSLSDETYLNMIRTIINEFRRICKKGFGIYSDWKQFKNFWRFIPEAEPIIIYRRANGVPSHLHIIQNHHVILTTAPTIQKNCKSVWDDIRVLGEGYFFNEERFNHPTQTSLKATKRFIEFFSQPDDIVIDPFLGCGTTAVACKELQRNFITIEINPDYCKIAERRLANIPDKRLTSFIEEGALA